jgi:hypothetical protein
VLPFPINLRATKTWADVQTYCRNHGLQSYVLHVSGGNPIKRSSHIGSTSWSSSRQQLSRARRLLGPR